MRRSPVRAANLHRALSRRCIVSIGATHDQARLHRPPPWFGARWPTGGNVRKTADAARLRVVRRRSRAPSDPLKVVGIDDWAWRRNHRYASIICNLERCQIVTLLPDLRKRPPKPGSPLIQRSELSPVIGAEDMAKRRPRPCRTPVQVADAGI